jgi:hypothetical protein
MVTLLGHALSCKPDASVVQHGFVRQHAMFEKDAALEWTLDMIASSSRPSTATAKQKHTRTRSHKLHALHVIVKASAETAQPPTLRTSREARRFLAVATGTVGCSTSTATSAAQAPPTAAAL